MLTLYSPTVSCHHRAVAYEVMLAKNLVVVAGEIMCSARLDIECTVRHVPRDCGYTSLERGISADDCQVVISVSEQSSGLAQALFAESAGKGVAHTCRDSCTGSLCASDQAVVVGYAIANDCGMIPAEVYYAKQLSAALAKARRSNALPYLWPDGKTLVALVYEDGAPVRAHTIVVTAQHSPEVDAYTMKADLTDRVVSACIPAHLLDRSTRLLVNPPSACFSFGGSATSTQPALRHARRQSPPKAKRQRQSSRLP